MNFLMSYNDQTLNKFRQASKYFRLFLFFNHVSVDFTFMFVKKTYDRREYILIYLSLFRFYVSEI